jgi:23S rRNA (adenine2503-C2)-methyltransferase
MVKKNLCGLTADEIFELIRSSGFTAAHALLVSNSLYKKSVSDVSRIEKIPGSLKKVLLEIDSGLFLPSASEVSKDHSVKYLFRSEDGKEYETVFIPDNKRNTVCVSSQSGCRMGCSFCVTGRYGFHGNLSAGEIVNQIISLPQARRITHVVFMGMGEPLDNLDNVLKACKIITAEWGLAISKRNVTVSTVGILPGVEQFLRSSECNLTLSLYSPFSEDRKKSIPAETQFPVDKIIRMVKDFAVNKKRRFSLAYVMIKDVNDSDRHLEGLRHMLGGSRVRVNLLSYHPAGNDLKCSSSPERMQYFKHNLITSGISASIRKSRGTDISAACGLLAANH